MFVEIRAKGKHKKYYLVHSYRIGESVKRISRYLGSNLSEKELAKLRQGAEKHILAEIAERNVLEFELSKIEIEHYRKYEQKIDITHLQVDWKRFTEEFTYNTNAIEGSTVDEGEVHQLLNNEEIPVTEDDQETLNVAEAVDFIRKTKSKFSVKLMLELHKICFKGTKPFAGKLRDVDVVIRDAKGEVVHRGAPKKEVKQLLEELVLWYEQHKDKYPPLLLAGVVHNQFEDIHPFQDGNGRVGRLLLNFVLLQHKYPPVNIRLEDRKNYYKILQIYDRTQDMKPTMRFLVSQYRKGVYKKK